MPSRLILILMLVWSQLVLPGAVFGAAPSGACASSTCCEVVRATTCCGEVVVETRCGKTGGHECRCGMESGDTEPVREAPRPAERTEVSPILVAPLVNVIHLPTRVRLQTGPAAPAIVRTHNETQALLCIWLT